MLLGGVERREERLYLLRLNRYERRTLGTHDVSPREAASFTHKCGAVPEMAPQNLSVSLVGMLVGCVGR